MTQDEPVRVNCADFNFIRLVRPADDDLPGEVLIYHGCETGHHLAIERQGDDELRRSAASTPARR